MENCLDVAGLAHTKEKGESSSKPALWTLGHGRHPHFLLVTRGFLEGFQQKGKRFDFHFEKIALTTAGRCGCRRKPGTGPEAEAWGPFSWPWCSRERGGESRP